MLTSVCAHYKAPAAGSALTQTQPYVIFAAFHQPRYRRRT
jgi:hypothetical protein